MKTTVAGNSKTLAWAQHEQGCPSHLKPPQCSTQRRFPPLWPKFDLWSLSRRQHFLDLIHLQHEHVSYFTASSFSCSARQQWGLVGCMVRCDSSNTLWFIKDILLASRGKKIPNQPTVAPVCPLNPHWPDHISAEAGNHRTAVVNHTHNTISICHFFPAPCSIAGTVWSVAPGCR